MIGSIFFHGWGAAARVAISATVIYIALVAVLRIVGQRALAKMSAYDLIVTVALGSMVASIPLTGSISIVDGLVAIATYLLLQELTSWGQTRWTKVHHAVREEPNVVLWEGKLLLDRMRDINVTPDEVRAAIRRAGIISLSQVQCVVLENDGEWAVIGRSDARDISALAGLRIPGIEWNTRPDGLFNRFGEEEGSGYQLVKHRDDGGAGEHGDDHSGGTPGQGGQSGHIGAQSGGGSGGVT